MDASFSLDQNEFDDVLVAAQVGVWVKDVTTGLNSWNDALFEIFEIPKAEFKGTDACWKQRVHSEDVPLIESAERICLHSDRLLKLKYRVVTSNGNIKIVKNRVRGIANADGQIVKIIGVNIDVTEILRAQEEVALDLTERRKSEEDNVRLQQQLLRIEKLDSLGTFAGGIAHDFNNFLAAISGQIELALERKKSAEEMHGVLNKILQISHRAEDLVSRILTFSKVPQLRSDPVEIGELIRETMELLEASISSEIELRVGLADERLVFLGDRIQVQQVLMNMINNSVQALSGQPGSIHVRSYKIPANSILGFPSEVAQGGVLALEYSCLQIKDTGSGIRRENLKKIFDPMFTTKGPQEGTGLGLSVSQSIIRGHGGWITATSDGKSGSTFQIFLPIANSNATSIGPLNSPGPLQSPIGKGAKKILIVDDDPEVLGLLVEALELQREFDVVPYSDSTQALQAFRVDPACWSLVVTDLTMPGLNGVDLSRSIHALREDLPVILITGFDRSQVMKQDKLCPNTHLVLKPFRTQALRDRIVELTSPTASLQRPA